MLSIDFTPHSCKLNRRLKLKQALQIDVNDTFFIRSDKKVLAHAGSLE